MGVVFVGMLLSSVASCEQVLKSSSGDILTIASMTSFGRFFGSS